MNPKNLVEAGSLLVDVGLPTSVVAREALASEAAALTRSSRSILAAAGERIQTMADLLQGRPGDVVTVVPRRIISGSTDGTISSRTLSIDVLGPRGLMERIKEPANRNIFGPELVNGDGRLHYLRRGSIQEQTHVTLSLGNRIIGIGGLQTNAGQTSELWVQHISVEAKHQGKGYARNIIESIYDYALQRNQRVVPSSFTSEGQRLKPIFGKMNARYPEAAASLPFKDL